MTSVDEVLRAVEEGRAAPVGAASPYYGRLVLAVAWRHGYGLMLRDMLDASPARQAYLREQRRRARRS